MSIVRDMGVTLVGVEERSLITCSTANAVFSATGNNIPSSTAAPGATGIVGNLIDRLAEPLTARYQVAMPTTHLRSSRGSTEADRKVTLGTKLQHGDSSGGGDMADYSTGSAPDDKNWFSTARTSDMLQWDGSLSTGLVALCSNPALYDLRGAKRYIRQVVYASKNRVTTESSGDEGARVSGTITFLGGDMVPQSQTVTRGPLSSSTST